MDYNQIKKLLDKYYEGESNPEEETLIREYLLRSDLPPEHQNLKQMFQYFTKEKNRSNPNFDITDKLQSVVENKWQIDNKLRFTRVLQWGSSVAAVFILGVGLYFYLIKPGRTVNDTYKDPDKAYLETKKALMYISECMNKKTSNLKYLAEIDKSYKKLNRLGEMDKIVNNLKSKKQ